MGEKKGQSDITGGLHQQREMLSGGSGTPLEEDFEALSPQIMRQMFYELQQQKIELDIQKEKLCCAEAALRESEEQVQAKMNAILLPDGDIGVLTLGDIIDVQAIQRLMDDFYSLTHIGVALLDLKGNILVATGWQDICTKFHRVHPETARFCKESDLQLSQGVEPGTCKMYCCKNNMRDIATPVIIGGKHVGNLFLGQFLLDDEPIDYELFRDQARRYGFNETEYIAAYERIPRWSRETIDTVMRFYIQLGKMIANLSCNNIIQARMLSEKEQLMHSLQESQSMLRQILDTVPQAIFWKDSNSVYLGCNQVFADAVGLKKPEDIVGKTDFELSFTREDAEGYRADDRHVIAINEPKMHIIEQALRADGIRIWGDTCKMPIQDEHGNVCGVLGVYDDITERKRAEEEKNKLQEQLQQAQKMESVGRLAGGVAHDFNNMLGVILGNLEMAMETVEPSHPIFFSLQEIHTAAERSASLTRQLLAFARKQTTIPEVLDLNKTIKGMLNMLQRIIGEHISIQWQPEPELWPIKTDPSQIDQILANLCVNARDAFEDSGTVVIKAENMTFDEGYCVNNPDFMVGDFVQITVGDNGCGMNEETLAQIFEPFFTTKGVGKGTGLGLATVYGIVKQNRGFVTVNSNLGQGTTFNLYFPRYVGETALKPAKNSTLENSPGRETILIVEDEKSLLQLTAKLLKRQGYTVLTASVPDDAIRKINEYADSIHLLITDVIMPEMNGRDLAK